MRYDEIPCTAAVLIMEPRLASSGLRPAPETFVPILYPARLKKLFARNRVIWLPFLDLCEALAVLRGTRAVLVREADLPEASADKERLLRRAEANALSLMPPVIAPLKELLPEGLAGDDEGELLVITNSRNNRGASAVCCPGVLEEAARRVGGDFYLLPSSIHEMICLPVSAAPEVPGQLADMVREINRTVLTEEEYLADSAYRYDVRQKRLAVAACDTPPAAG